MLPLLNQFLMVLVRLHINMDVQQLAYHFGIHSSNISRKFRKWIDVMYERLKPLIKWPEQEQLYMTMPMGFREKFRKCVVVLDCFEIFIERPAALMTWAQTWPNYYVQVFNRNYSSRLLAYPSYQKHGEAQCSP